MKAKKAYDLTIKSKSELLYKHAISDIKNACMNGFFSCKIKIEDYLLIKEASKINQLMFDKLERKGYWFGSTVGNNLRNVFWGEKEN